MDINPFLVWFTRTKTVAYTAAQLEQVRSGAEQIVRSVADHPPADDLWYPPIRNIHRWWPAERRQVLAQIYHELRRQFPRPTPVKDLLLVAFCQLVIHWSNASFNHQSMSFKAEALQPNLFDTPQLMLQHFRETVQQLTATAEPRPRTPVHVVQADARHAPPPAQPAYDCVITSPPYPNRMSYIRELRPYMYWLGYLKEAREAGELDWQAIGGTWGIATSRLNHWQPNGQRISYPGFKDMLSAIATHSEILSKYVQRYFLDMLTHFQNLRSSLAGGARLYYIVGNSKFYDTLVPVEAIYAHLMQDAGFENVNIERLRKRNSKKELFEFLLSAQCPA